MTSRSRIKGSRIEREIAQMFKELGFYAMRVDEKMGQLGKTQSCDVDVYIDGTDKPPWKVEIKARRNGEGFKNLDAWLANNELLILRKDRSEPSVYMNWKTFKKLLWFVNKK